MESRFGSLSFAPPRISRCRVQSSRSSLTAAIGAALGQRGYFRNLKADAPAGSRFKDYASFVVQDLAVRPHVTDFLRECWRTPDGKTVTAPLPPGVDGHFGPELRRLVLALYHQGQVTVARLVTLLRGFGILISKRQVVRLLIARKQNFL